MATEKRERQRENRAKRQAELAAAESQAKQSDTTKRIVAFVGIAVVALLAIFFLTRGGDDAEDVSAGSDADTEIVDDVESIDEPSEDDVVDGSLADDAAPANVADLFPADGECPPEDGSGDRVTSFDGPQPLCIDLDKSYSAEVVTNAGNFTIEFDTQRAPVATNNFVTLARHRFYEGVNFHRVISGFMIQGGDAVGTPPGTGGPGYQFADEPQGGEGPFYEVGSVAMANSGPNTNGSQFFVVTGAGGVDLPDQYTRFGTVTAGMETVTAIEASETDEGDAPVSDMTIESVTITES